MPTKTGWKTYRDFVITIKGADEGRYRVEASGATGEATTTFVLPFDDQDVEIFLLKVGHPRRMTIRGRVPEPVQPSVEFGAKLFNAVIDGDVRDIFVSARHDALRSDYGLRLQLRLSHVPELADLPWEFLYDGRDFLALSPMTPVVRYLDLRNPPRPMEVPPPLRILVTISAPYDQPQLDVETEKAKVQEALAPLEERGMLELDFAPDATLPTLRRTMRRAKRLGCPHHVWHYIGHGAFDPVAQASVLAFCDRVNRSYPVGGFQLGTLFNSLPEIRLVLLNACEGARPDPRDPFAGVAAAVVERGVPAVIGMQFEISDEAANAFAEEFYQALANGLPVDAALADARQAVFFLPNWIEWATPVLFMRSPDGQLFDLSAPPRPVEPPPKVVKPREGAHRERLAALYTDALAAYFAERWERAIELLSEIVALDEGYQDAAAELAEARRQKTLADLYADARRLHQAQNWQAAGVVFERIEALDPAYPDPEGLFAWLQRERTLAALYQQGLVHMNARAWAEALEPFEEIGRLQAGYRETEALLARARRELAKSGARRDILTLGKPVHLELVRIPAGEFLMGSDPAVDKAARDNEQPQHRVYVAEFFMGKYPVTNAQYAAFARATGHEMRSRGKDDYPVVKVTWHDAVAFCEWLSRETGQAYRLPTEAEWEKAARGDDGRLWPWGNDWNPAQANCKPAGPGATTPVGQYSPGGDSPYGCADMAGNVWEWCSDWNSSDTYRRRPGRVEKNPEGPDSGDYKVLRGGSWYYDRNLVRCAYRGSYYPVSGSNYRGFRVARGPSR
jgi:formylglycine-generating enzyme required for sulfatase activity